MFLFIMELRLSTGVDISLQPIYQWLLQKSEAEREIKGEAKD